ncbi:hypothetical protein C8R43DRAFT_943027 [Mycena crocata]|nr:hypothetical protein C8R43DRAFT_943027 [Mycena crocata]
MPDEFVSGCWNAFNQTIWTYEDGTSSGRDAQMFQCNTSYQNNYSVSGGTRTYYAGVPDAIQVGEHQFVERQVLNLFVGLMLISWTSATNAARVYDTCLSKPENRPQHKDWPPSRSFHLRTEHVWDGFLVLSLLEDYEEHNKILQVPNTGEQNVRFNDAIRERNSRFRLNGQPEWSHYCNKCMRVWKESDGDKLKKLHVLVVDGITIGHPCCGVHDCPEALITNRHRFCRGHDHRHHICAVEGFTAEEVEEMVVGGNDCKAAKDPNGNRKIRALFGRRRTHNEQIFLRPCGIIVAHATFYASESVSQTVVSIAI